MKFFLCECGKKAEWVYMPSSDYYPYYCDECVPRGCTCNDEYAYEYEAENGEIKKTAIEDTIQWYEKNGMKWIWKEEGKCISHVDDKGRLLPCCEYFYNENGWEAEEDEMNSYNKRNLEFQTTEE